MSSNFGLTIKTALLGLLAMTTASNAYRGRIINGSLALDGEFPFMLSLRRFVSGRHVCGASVLNRGWALTAAHCVAGTFPARINLQFGSNELDADSTSVVNVSKIFVHEGYQPHNQYINDIALLKLKAPLVFGSKVRAIRLPEANQNITGNEPAVLIGWGHNATGGTLQTHLQKVHLQTYTDRECSALHEIELHESNLCAGVPEGGKGQCTGDSGGPLLVDGKQVGIVSWSRKPCSIAPYPGVYTEVAAYLDWILKTIGDETEKEESNKVNESAESILTGDLIVVSLKHASNLAHFCAGTILNEFWILTAAHCFTFIKNPREVKIQYGSTKLQTDYTKLIEAEEIIEHEGYNPTIAVHDIALIKLSTAIPFDGQQTLPVKLTEHIEWKESQGTLIGWGLNATYGGVIQRELQKVQLDVLDPIDCSSKLPAFIHKTNICAFRLNGGQCSGDSGGPLLLENTQIGIVSWSLKPCALYPGVFTNIVYYRSWINDKLK